MRLTEHIARAVLRVIALIVFSAGVASAQITVAQPGRALSLDDALRLALPASDAIAIARAGIERATGQLQQARSAYLPQVSASGSYTRTLRSQFSALNSSPTSAATDTAAALQSLCAPNLPSTATDAERAAALARAASCPLSTGVNLAQAGFGAPNQFSFGLSFSQTLFDWGSTRASTASARAGQRSAAIELTAQQAQLTLDVAQAYFDAALSDALLTIADSTYTQAERVFTQTQLARTVGSQSGYEVLRAQVNRDNQIPVVLQRRSQRQTAYYTLKQLLGLPLDQPVQLTTPVDTAGSTPTVRSAALVGASAAEADTAADRRAGVRQQREALAEQEAALQVARAGRLPAVSLTSSYSRVAFPNSFSNASLSQFRTNWTVGVGVSVPLYTGGRTAGEERVARANVAEARATLSRLQKSATLDARQALLDVEQADATYRSTAGTAGQAERAYQISEVRYRGGAEAQNELTDARLSLAEARSNRAQAARNAQVARVRLALLPNLPLSSSGAATTMSAASTSSSTTTGSAGSGTGSGTTGTGTTTATQSAATSRSTTGTTQTSLTGTP